MPHKKKPAKPPRKRKALKEPTFLTEEEIERLFRVIRDIRDRALFMLIYHRGMRASEPGLLQFSDFRAPGRGRARLLVRRKKGSITAEHPLVDVEAAALRAWIRLRGNRPGTLFLSRNHHPLGPDQVAVLYRRYAVLAGIPRDKAHPHALKHSCAMHLVKLLNGNVVEIQDHLGHADVRNTMRYLRAAERDERAEKIANWGKPRQQLYA